MQKQVLIVTSCLAIFLNSHTLWYQLKCDCVCWSLKFQFLSHWYWFLCKLCLFRCLQQISRVVWMEKWQALELLDVFTTSQKCRAQLKNSKRSDFLEFFLALPSACRYPDRASACRDYNGSCWKVGFAFERRSLEFWTRVPGRRRLAGCLWTQRSGDSRERFGQEPSSLAPSHQAGEHQENTKWREERTRTNVWRESREDDQMKKSLKTENIYLVQGWHCKLLK